MSPRRLEVRPEGPSLVWPLWGAVKSKGHGSFLSSFPGSPLFRGLEELADFSKPPFSLR